MTPDDRTCIELKQLYLEALHQILATKKPKENMRGIRRILDYRRTHPIGGSPTRRAPHVGLVGPAPAARQHHQVLQQAVHGRQTHGHGR